MKNVLQFALIIFMTSCGSLEKKSVSKMDKEELGKIIKLCGANSQCVRANFKESKSVAMMKIGLVNTQAVKSEILDVKGFKIFESKIINGPLARIFIEDKEAAKFRTLVEAKQKVNLALVSGNMFVFSMKMNHKWKKEVYNKLLIHTEDRSKKIKAYLEKHRN